MKIARVVGSAISTIEDVKIKDTKLLICRPTDQYGDDIGKAYVAVDLVDSGVGDLVLTCHGSAARQTYLTKDTPVDAVIMAVIDHLEVDGEFVFRK
jgi:microcompartment protein CcmK/EutM